MVMCRLRHRWIWCETSAADQTFRNFGRTCLRNSSTDRRRTCENSGQIGDRRRNSDECSRVVVVCRSSDASGRLLWGTGALRLATKVVDETGKSSLTLHDISCDWAIGKFAVFAACRRFVRAGRRIDWTHVSMVISSWLSL